ncbi:DUF4870 domain-containing protein [Candidatus Sumerlaeota bacterium]|nr:DUF4870 domain-containing protein [Candidatus Sumerlaeota bacterium]
MTSPETEKQARMWAMLIHLSILVPCLGIVLPVLIWQIKKSEFPDIDPHGKMVTNWLLSLLIYGAVSWLLMLVFIGYLVGGILTILWIAFAIVGGIKANEGELWKYPLAIQFIK